MAEKGKISGLRWWIVALIFLATVVNYLDRMTINVAAPKLVEIFGITETQKSIIFSGFLWAYLLMPGFAGWLMDKLGSRTGYILSMTVWSLAGVLTIFALPVGNAILSIIPLGLSAAVVGFTFFRFILGSGESANWPVAVKTISEWFPARERSFAVGIFNCGSSVGATIAPLIVTWILIQFGWQAVFVVTGSVGFIWVIFWYLLYRKPEDHPALSEKEKEYIFKGREDGVQVQTGEHGTTPVVKKLAWKDIFKHRQVIGIIITRFFMDPVWWFYTFWLFSYLVKDRGFEILKMGIYGTIPFLTSDFGNLFGGWASSQLIKKGWSINRARKTVMVISALFIMLGIPAAFSKSPYISIALISLVTFFYQSWSVNMLTFPADIAPRHLVGSIMGMSVMGATLGGLVVNYATGIVADTFKSFTPIIIYLGLVPLIGIAMLFLVIGEIKRID